MRKTFRLKNRIFGIITAVAMVITMLPHGVLVTHAEDSCGHINATYEWEDETAHYMDCPDCDDDGSVGHYFGEDTVCDQCGYMQHEHTAGADGRCTYQIGDKVCGLCTHINTEYGHYSDVHFLYCSDCSNQLGDYEEHDFENGSICIVCGCEKECTHSNAGYRWEDEIYHYMDCPDCDFNLSIAHDFGGDTACDDCGYIQHEHTAGADGRCTYQIGDKVCGLCTHINTEYEHYSDVHFLYCSDCLYQLGDVEEHDFENGRICIVCGYEKECPHSNADYRWENETGHYMDCPDCDGDGGSEHYFGEDTVCDECGYIQHEHTAGADGRCTYQIGDKVCGLCTHINTEYVHYSDAHFQYCSDCLYQLGDVEEHDFENGRICIVCGYEKECPHSNADYWWENEYVHYRDCPDCDNDGSVGHDFGGDTACDDCGYIQHEHTAGADGRCTYQIGDKVCGVCAHAGDLDYEPWTEQEHDVYCGVCDIWMYDEEHTWDDDGLCIQCGQCSHDGGIYYVQYSFEYHAVCCEICDEIIDYEDHIWGDDGYCTQCGECPHLNTKPVPLDEEYHCDICTDCGDYSDASEYHIWDNGVCEICGYFVHEHEAGSSEYLDVFFHSTSCKTQPCYIQESESHDYSQGACLVCGSEKPTGIFVAGKLITDGEYVDCNGNTGSTQPAGGYAYYKNGKLTLNNFVFDGAGYVEEDDVSPVIYIRQDVEIVLEGENSLTNPEDDVIKVFYGDITIGGTGSLALTTEDDYDGIDLTDGNLVINSGTITIEAIDNGIELDPTCTENKAAITVNGGKLDITAGDDGIDAEDDVTINGGTININADDNAVDSGKNVVITGGKIYLTGEDYDGIVAYESISISGGYMEINAYDSGLSGEKIDITGGNILIDSIYQAMMANSSLTISGDAKVVAPENAKVEYIEIYDEYFLVDENGEIVCYTEILSHRHDWQYTAAGATITLTCKNADGDCYDTDGGSITLVSPGDTVYTGQPVEADYIDNIKTADVNSIMFTYTTEDELTDGVPVNAGTYKITLGVGDKQVSSEYTIAPAEVTYTAPEPTAFDYTGVQQQLIAAGTAENGTMYYSFDGENWMTDIPTARNAGTYTVWYKVAADKNYTDVAAQSVEAVISTAELTLEYVTVEGKTYDGTPDAQVQQIVISGIAAGDDVAADMSRVKAQFADKNAGLDKTVAVTGIVLKGADAANYSLAETSAQATADIIPATIKVEAATGQFKVYGAEDPVFEYTVIEGRLFGNDVLEGAISREDGENAGEYDFSIGTLANSNYDIVFDNTVKFIIQAATPDLSGVTATIPANSTDIAEIVFAGAGVPGTYTDIFAEELVWGENEVTYLFNPDDEVNYTKEQGTVKVTVTDTIAPTGSVSVNTNSWNSLLNNITFGLLFNRTVDVNIYGSDALSGVAAVEYLESAQPMTLEQLKNADSWTAVVNNKVRVTAEDAKQFIYYARITDRAGNVTMISSDGMEYDLTPPAIGGLTDGATYCTTQKFTVTDAHPDYVEINGIRTTDFVLAGDREESYVIYAMDKAGNFSVITVHMETIDKLDDDIGNLTEDTVTADDKADIEAVKEILAGVNQDTATEEEKALIENIKDFVEGLEKAIEKTEEEVKALEDALAGYDKDTVKSTDEADVDQLISDLTEKLDDENLSAEQKETLTESLEEAKALAEKIDRGKQALEDANNSVPAVDTEDVTADDAEDIAAAKDKLEDIVNSGNYTEEEKQSAQDQLEKIEELEKVIEETKEAVDEAAKANDDFTAENVKSSDKAEIEENIAEIKAVLEEKADNLTEEQKQDLEAAKAAAEELLEEIADNARVLEEVLEAEKATTKDNYAVDDKADLEAAAEALKAAAEDENYTEQEQKAAQDELDRINSIVRDIEEIEEAEDNAAEAAEKQNGVQVVPDNREAVEAAAEAKQAYDRLDERQKALLGQETAKQIDDLYQKATAFEIIKGADGIWTKGSSKGLEFTANGNFSFFEAVEVDGEVIGAGNYTAVAGSTVVTLKAEYLKTLETGKHTLAVVYSVGADEHSTDECEFTVKAKPKKSDSAAETTPPEDNVPPTGDSTGTLGWALVMLSSMAALAVIFRKKKEYEDR